MRTPLALLLTLLGAAVLAGCGTPPHYTLGATRSCLAKDGARLAGPKGDFVAQSATVGAFRATLPGGRNFVTISFGEDDADAKNISDGYLRFHQKNVGISDVLYLDKNVVLLWREHPTAKELSRVTNCLK